MVLQAGVRTFNIGSGVVIPDHTIKEVQTNAVGPVRSAHLGIEIVKRATVVLVNVPVFDKYALGRVSKLSPEALRDALRIELRIQNANETIVVCRGLKLNPVVGRQCDSTLSIASPKGDTEPGGDGVMIWHVICDERLWMIRVSSWRS